MNSAVVITTINPPTKAFKTLAARKDLERVIAVGDQKTPHDWRVDGVEFLPLDAQEEIAPELASAIPRNHYSRKNIGYLRAAHTGAERIVDTDDDNIPYGTFPGSDDPTVRGREITSRGWHNVYRNFSPRHIWPRGFPLEFIARSFDRSPEPGRLISAECPVQQYLADGDPDVDAVYRLTTGSRGALNEDGFSGTPVILGEGAWCPFNSQNTVWWAWTLPLMYLPCFVSFRMTDIWRSFVAQVCLQALGYRISFHAPTVFQDRNQHDLLSDFESEIPGYRHNDRIMRLLDRLDLGSGVSDLAENVRTCYCALIESEIVPPDEQRPLEAWLVAADEVTPDHPVVAGSG